MGDDIVVDPLSRIFGGDISMPVIDVYEETHEIIGDFSLPTLFPVARSVTPKKEGRKDLRVVPLTFTNPKSWAETDFKKPAPHYDKGKDLKGPFPLAVAVSLLESEKKEVKGQSPRIVAVGDSDFVSNSFIRFSGNKDFFLNIINWLAQEEGLISISRPKAAKIGTIIINQRIGNTYFYLTVVTFPLIIFLAGTLVWFRRRRL